jgi:hypothetical protein
MRRLPRGSHLKCFTRVGDIGLLTIDAGFHQSFVQQGSRRSNEWTAFKIFFVARLLADKEHAGMRCAFAKYGLRGVLPQIACATVLGGLSR